MDARYGAYCLADPVFYESPATGAADLAIAARQAPEGWRRAEREDWLSYAPVDAALPPQGWKVHASACPHNAEAVAAAVWDHCVDRGIAFKFVRAERLVMLRNAKYASRESSGKFATIYPRTEAELEQTLTELGEALDGQPGPYILSDLRWGGGPLYVRYGGFVARSCLGDDGTLTPAIEDDDGNLVPDRRGATFAIPPWVTPPDFLEPHLTARENGSLEAMPYAVEGALHFSNGGGVYDATDRSTGERVVLKEARPHAGLGFDGADAVARLDTEREALERLDGVDCVPTARGFFTVEDHRFLAQEHMDGAQLNRLLVERYPLMAPEADPERVAAYCDWALAVHAEVERAVAAVHDRGVVIGDLQPANVLIRPDGRAALVDFEAAGSADHPHRAAVATPGFMAPTGVTGRDADRHALACLRLWLFLPLTQLFQLDPGKAAQHADVIAGHFPVPREFLDEALAMLGRSESSRRSEREREDWRGAMGSMRDAIVSSATPERGDRLFPGDVAGFVPGGGINLAHGAAGVLYSLDAAGLGRYAEQEEWLVRQVARPPAATPLGFYNGLHGVAHALDRLGRDDEAAQLLDVCAERIGRLDDQPLNLFGGLSGIGLNLAHFERWDEASRVAGAVADRLEVEDVRAGLMGGRSGAALLFIRLYEHTSDAGLLDLAATALRQDLRRCVTRDDGAMHVDEGRRTLPYVGDGSAGIALVLERYLRHGRDGQFEEAAAAIRRAASSIVYALSGLFNGRAGMILLHDAGGAEADAQLRRLAWHALEHRGDLAFPGDGLLRISMDLATGTAGVLLAVAAALGEDRAQLPFLEREGTHLDTRTSGAGPG